MSQYWLLKTEPSDYSQTDLERDVRTIWDGVSNNLALKHLRNMKRGDLAFIYHTGKERALVGIAEVISDPYPDPGKNDAKLVVVDVRAKEALPQIVSLAEVKADSEFSDFPLVRLPRLSVMPVTPAQWNRLLAMAGASRQWRS
ncbi:MAG: EVE domain-containing protein [Acidobacteria bacterium]|nr:EVE domain-containing protein [Acidobacteriota bacterium]